LQTHNITTLSPLREKAEGFPVVDFIGVSKSSVSKWETEQSYPDIVHFQKERRYGCYRIKH